MIGQVELLKKLSDLLTENKFPRTSILVGEEGSGKKTLCHELCKQANWTPVYIGTKVDEIREMIKNAYTVVSKVLYIIPDADKMTANASNALLKVLEEPPNNAYFILLYTDINTVLNTIKSRSTIFNMQPYSTKELNQYLELVNISAPKIVLEVCETPGDIDLILNYDVHEFFEYGKKVVEHIATVSSANCFKIADKVAIKKESDGYDLRLFWKMFMAVCFFKMKNENVNLLKYAVGVTITSKYLQDLRLRGVNRQTLIDMWILDIRKAWM